MWTQVEWALMEHGPPSKKAKRGHQHPRGQSIYPHANGGTPPEKQPLGAAQRQQQGVNGERRKHQAQRKELPIWSQRTRIVEVVKSHGAVILVAETGSGKSTQVPQFLLDGGLCKGPGAGASKRLAIACTQPRRVAAMTVAERVAEEMGTQLGNAVGYAVRFDDRTSERTCIKYVTDGVLLREAMADPLLSKYSVIILDEAHERSLQTDILFGLIRRIMRRRAELRVMVMSATLEVDAFTRFFQGAAVVKVEGRQFAVDVYYASEPQDDYVDAACVTALQIHEAEPPGDVLVFLPGQEDIEALTELLNEYTPPDDALRVEVCPLYAALPPEQQLRAFQPAATGTRKFVLATNIAETSVTINGVRYVVDSGFVKVRRFVASTGLESLKVSFVAKSQANQRAGRAGREAPGCCYRLYTEPDYEKLPQAAEPEIQRVNLAQVVLQLLMIGVEQPQAFDYLSPPSPRGIVQALETLLALGCIEAGADAPVLTAHGRRVASLPLSPVFAHLLLLSTGPALRCACEALTAAAMLSVENVLYMPPPGHQDDRQRAAAAHRALAAYDGDVLTLVHVYERWSRAGHKERRAWCTQNFVNGRSMDRASDIRRQLQELLRRLGEDPTTSCGPEKGVFVRCLAAGLFLNVAQRQPPSEGRKGCYKVITSGREVFIHPSSVLHGRNPPPQWVTFTEVVITTRAYIRGVTVADPAALQELVPRFFKATTTTTTTR